MVVGFFFLFGGGLRRVRCGLYLWTSTKTCSKKKSSLDRDLEISKEDILIELIFLGNHQPPRCIDSLNSLARPELFGVSVTRAVGSRIQIVKRLSLGRAAGRKGEGV